MIAWWLACQTPTEVTAPPRPDVLLGPVVEHRIPDQPLQDGDLLTIEASATDEDGVAAMELRVRVAGELFYDRVPMERVEGDEESTVRFVATVFVQAPGVEYVLRAFDDSDYRIPGTFPLEAEGEPVYLDVASVPTLAPWTEDFEGEVDFGLFGLGWNEVALAFRGERWGHSSLAYGGDRGARHRDGFPGMQPVDDWLISPLLDFSALETAEVRWHEFGSGTPASSAHALWISTGSADPGDGDFVKVQGLQPPPLDAWRSAPVVDLTPWAGEPRVSLAWRYEAEGQAALWAIDDVRIGPFAPDLQLLSATAGRVEPGGTVGVQVQLHNLGAPTNGAVLLDGSVVGGLGGFGAPVDLGSLASNQLAAGVLWLTVDPEQPDNTLLQAQLLATDGPDGYTWPFGIQVGDPTVGLVRLHVEAPGLVQVWLGVGEQAQPFVEEPVFQGQLGTGIYTLSVDLADHLAWLPSEPGRGRWWARVRSDANTRMLGFGIDHDGAVTWSDDFGPVAAGVDGVFYLPERARPVVLSLVPDPSPLAPGSPGSLRLTLANRGGPTVGITEARLSADPALGLAVDFLPLPSDWEGQATLEVPVNVAASHTNSQPLALHLDVVDAGEAYPVDVVVPVPWPRLVFSAPLVTDPTGNADGVLVPGEQVGVLVTVSNVGALATGELTCTLTQTEGPTASITPQATVALLNPGVGRALNLQLTANGAVVGDDLGFAVACSDAVGTWEGEFSIAVGGAAWIPLNVDPTGDAMPGASFDLREVRFRVDGGQIELELTAVDAIDPGTLHLELWTDSPGSSFSNVVLTVLDGVPSLFGVQSGGWIPLPAPSFSVHGSTIRIGLTEADLGLSENTLQVALGTGFCGTPELYCEHWPDGWGNPYAGGLNVNHWVQFGW